MIYFDNAATTLPKPKAVGEAMVEALNSFGNPSRGGHEYSLRSSRVLYETRELLAKLIGVEDPLNIAFTGNSTMSLNIAILGLGLKEGDEIITTTLEHNSVLRPIYKLKKNGVKVKFIGSDRIGNINYDELEASIGENTKAIIATHASNLTGNLVDIDRIGKAAHRNNLIFIVDGSQSLGVFPVDVVKNNIDILCFTGHKGLMGPTGVGGIYVSPKVDLNPYLVGGSGSHSFSEEHPKTMPDKLEAGTPNIHGIAGLNASLKYIFNTGVDTIREKELSLAKTFYEGIKDLPKVKIYGDFNSFYRSPIVTINLEGVPSSDLSEVLSYDYGIATRSGIHCAPLMHNDFKTNENGMVRFSFSHYNTMEEILKTIEILKTLSESI
ncbi:aminotransferase class V-fold PLP-dependent enzyme [Fusobacteria bacterium ZRK30]|nr:aminotransferase class V-fold PLP-dependent enzyme [Fusobacteria bacterium ZRK30]